MSSYNVKSIQYLDGQQVRVYKKPVVVDDSKKVLKEVDKQLGIVHLPKSHKSSCARTYEQIQHSITSSHNRTKNKVYEISRSNEWEYFITLTFNPKLIDSTDYELLACKVSDWLGNLKKRYAPDLKYLLVPELHKDGLKYHFHGLLANCGNIQFYASGHFDTDGNEIYNILNFKYGFSTATKVKDNNRISGYITKYITKELCSVTQNKKRYWCSRNLNKPVVTTFNLSYEDIENILDDCSENIEFIKTVDVPQAHNGVKYIEMS